jgi:GNAT superfamily N-acetyltransferase
LNNIAIVRADKDLLPQLVNIWHSCFGDEEAYIKYYYSCIFDRSETYAVMHGLKAVGMLHLLPAEIDGRKAYYGYAMAMLPEYRGKGLFLQLQEYIFELVKERDAAYFLKPANRKLESYYQTQGFGNGLYLNKITIEAAVNCKLKHIDIEPEEYKSLRDSCFNKPGYVKWALPFIEYAIAENRKSGGIVKKIVTDSGEFAIFGIVRDNILHIREAAIPDKEVIKLCSELSYYYHTERTEIELPVYSIHEPQEILTAGMIYNMEAKSSAYFNLPLD